jgi:hypothetical protein
LEEELKVSKIQVKHKDSNIKYLRKGNPTLREIKMESKAIIELEKNNRDIEEKNTNLNREIKDLREEVRK